MSGAAEERVTSGIERAQAALQRAAQHNESRNREGVAEQIEEALAELDAVTALAADLPEDAGLFVRGVPRLREWIEKKKREV